MELRATKGSTSLAVRSTLETALQEREALETDGWTVEVRPVEVVPDATPPPADGEAS